MRISARRLVVGMLAFLWFRYGAGGPVTRRPTCSIGRLPALSPRARGEAIRGTARSYSQSANTVPALESLAARATSSIEVSLNPQRVKTPVAISTSLARRGDGSGTVSLAFRKRIGTINASGHRRWDGGHPARGGFAPSRA